jgi:hypothetical protein
MQLKHKLSTFFFVILAIAPISQRVTAKEVTVSKCRETVFADGFVRECNNDSVTEDDIKRYHHESSGDEEREDSATEFRHQHENRRSTRDRSDFSSSTCRKIERKGSWTFTCTED